MPNVGPLELVIVLGTAAVITVLFQALRCLFRQRCFRPGRIVIVP